jgi:hypothetical protein
MTLKKLEKEFKKMYYDDKLSYELWSWITKNFIPKEKKTECEHDWITSLDGTELWCPKCKFLSQGHPMRNLQESTPTQPIKIERLEPIDRYQYPENLAKRFNETMPNGDIKLGQQPLEYELLDKVNQIINYLNSKGK